MKLTERVYFWGRLALCALTAAAGLAAMCETAHAADPASADNAALLKRGEYLATAGDCVACHTAPTGKPFAGGLPLATPLGNIISTNITPSKTGGIGNYTYGQFSDAVRKGIRADGAHLYPAMPYTSYAQVTDDDMKALYAYFMQGVTPVDEAASASSLPFPFNIRLSMAAWNMLFLDSKPFEPDPSKSAEWNRGAYLVKGLAHCSTCHSPRNALMAEETSQDLAGGAVGPWVAPNITSDANSGVGAWSEAELVSYMRTGHATGKAQAAGPMAEAVDNSLRHLSDADLQAMAVYLKTVQAVHQAGDTQPPATWGKPVSDLEDVRGVAWPADVNQLGGVQLYDGYCASCHQAKGEGASDGGLPSLFHNTALGRSNTNNLVMVMLDGVHRQADTPDMLMPGFAQLLTDQQIATLGNYLLKRYGNVNATVTVDQVRALRAGGESSSLVGLARAGIMAAVLIVLGIVALLVVRRSRRRASAA
ncbi:c-type cytochrome [Paraburkholderia sartisoli]|uniref:Cytochrome c, mono-and diheme variants n=1 Tax=Paraburkholderia sartisoli TaxID=83784 RepID=A0A1H4CKK7_9BURK|nr:cytochrome c [Paraburkholderia sartisoli]SEA60965.1 Cytochrome c, mono-and diheme variants [Paraburkholderia sartisoli]